MQADGREAATAVEARTGAVARGERPKLVVVWKTPARMTALASTTSPAMVTARQPEALAAAGWATLVVDPQLPVSVTPGRRHVASR